MTEDRDMNEDLEALRRRSDQLAEAGDTESDEVVRVNEALFEVDPTDREICERLGIALDDRGELEAARVVFEQGLAANPQHGVARRRLEAIKRRLAEQPERKPEEVIEPALEALDETERATCLSFIAASIEETEAIDPDALAVAESPGGFAVWGGMAFACEPNDKLFNMKLHEVGSWGLIERIEAAGGTRFKAARVAVPNQVWVGIPVQQLEDFRDEIMEAHRRHLEEAIEAGKNPHLARHRPDLRKYLLDEADKASAP